MNDLQGDQSDLRRHEHRLRGMGGASMEASMEASMDYGSDANDGCGGGDAGLHDEFDEFEEFEEDDGGGPGGGHGTREDGDEGGVMPVVDQDMLRQFFDAVDRDGDGCINVRELLRAVRLSEHSSEQAEGNARIQQNESGSSVGAAPVDPELLSTVLQRVLHLPVSVRQEDGTREAFERVFQAMDVDGSRDVDWQEFLDYCLAHVERVRGEGIEAYRSLI